MTYFGTRLSENISRREPEGYLICLNVPVARTGTQEYFPSELGLSVLDDRLIPVLRPESEVFAPACVASFEGMPVTDDHPSAPEGVTSGNIRMLQKGHTQHVRRGSGPESDLLLADLMITDPVLIDEVLAGKREISCGYNYVLCEEDGKFIQREIRGNHVAVVDAGRAGPRVSIRDQEPAEAAVKKMCALLPVRPSCRPLVPDSVHGSTPDSDPVAVSTQIPDRERSTLMKKKSLWRAKMMARMAKDGDVDGLAEIITEMMEEAEEIPAEAAAVPVLPAASPAADPVVEAVASAVAENLEGGAPAGSAPAAAAPVVVETPVEQPVLIDCGPEILEALRQIISLLSASQADCGGSRTKDEDPAGGQAAEEAVAEELAETLTENLAGSLAENLAEAAAEAAAEVIDPAAGEDPVEELVAEILESGSEDPGSGEDPADIVSGILDPETISDEGSESGGGEEDGEGDEDDPISNARAADALRAALAEFRPRLARISSWERQRFNANVAARMKKLTRKSGSAHGRPNAYAALRRASAHDRSDRSLGKKIMASRNANLAKRK